MPRNILIYCPDQLSSKAIARHLVDIGNCQLFFAESEGLVQSLSELNSFHLVVLFDPTRKQALLDLKTFLRASKPRLKVRVLPDKSHLLQGGWRGLLTTALASPKKGKPKQTRAHPRFRWKPD